MKLEKLFKTRDAFLYFIVYLVALVFFSAIFICLKAPAPAPTPAPTKIVDALLDFVAYAFPILAGVMAGGGIYFKDDAELFFGSSCFLLMVGLTGYMQTKGFGEIFILAGVLLCIVWTITDGLICIDEVAHECALAVFLVWLAKRVAFIVAAVTAVLFLLQRV